MENAIIPQQNIVCPVGNTLLVGAASGGPLVGLSKFYRKIQAGIFVAAGTAANITGVTILRGTGQGLNTAQDATRSAAALAALAAGNAYSLSLDGADVLDALGIQVTVGTAPVTLGVVVLGETIS